MKENQPAGGRAALQVQVQSLAAENAALKAKLARPSAGQQPRNGTALTVKQRNDLRSATQRIAKTWTGFDAPDEAWLTAQLDALPQKLRALRPESDWRKLILQWIERGQAKKNDRVKSKAASLKIYPSVKYFKGLCTKRSSCTKRM